MEFGLALSGGGLRGAAHIGVLKALKERDLYPSWISGTSAGSIIAGLYSCGYSPEEMEKLVTVLNKKTYDPDILGIIKGIFCLLIGKEPSIDGIIKGKRIEKLLKEWTKEKHINDSCIPIALAGVNVNNGQTVYFVNNKKGLIDDKYSKYYDDIELYKAVGISISIPVIFQTKMFNGIRLADGGVTDSLPVSVLKQMGAKKVIGVNLGYCGKLRKDIDNIIEIGNQSLDIMQYQITRLMNTGADLIINPHIHDVGLMEFDRIKECVDRGYKAAKDNMDSILKVIYK
ncbi:MAG: hypothetical protein FH761_02315 [Firmicutes bacterium]|nr:hypothetical protein [Bacillota bacterium]